MYFKYILLASISAFGKLFSFLFGWLLIAPWIWVKMDGNYPQPIRALFQPSDSPAIGDSMYAENQMAWTSKLPRWIAYYIRATCWSTARNPFYGFDSLVGFTIQNPISCVESGDPKTDIGLQATFGCLKRSVRNGNGRLYFDYKVAGSWTNSYGYMYRLGWSINSFSEGYHANLQIDIRPRIKLP